MELDLASVMIVEECFARDASYLVTHGAQAGIGALPLIYFGTEEQKSKYLPQLADASMIAAYALTEPQAGTDAMAIRTRADLTPDGKHYILNGQKMWITNGGIADLFTVFAKVDGEKFTAFLVERAYAGVTPGAEEHKMGLHGSSTTALYLDNVAVPVENVLGEVGRGHIIAFNVLNIGRLKIGPYAAGASKEVLALSLAYASERKAFGKHHLRVRRHPAQTSRNGRAHLRSRVHVLARSRTASESRRHAGISARMFHSESLRVRSRRLRSR